MNKKIFCFLFCILCFGMVGHLESAINTNRILLVDDFDRGLQSNRLGGQFGGDIEAPGFCFFRLEGNSEQVLRRGGYSLKLEYDVSENGSFSFFWMKLGTPFADNASKNEGLNIKDYRYLSFWVKGNQGKEKFKIELHQDTDGDGLYTGGKDKSAVLYVDHFLTKSISKEWQKAVIPLNEFQNLNQSSPLLELVLVFENHATLVKQSEVLIDNLVFGTELPQGQILDESVPFGIDEKNVRINGLLTKDIKTLDRMNLIRAKLNGDISSIESVVFEVSSDQGKSWKAIAQDFVDGDERFSCMWDTITYDANQHYSLRIQAILNDGTVIPLGSEINGLVIKSLSTDEFLDELSRAIFQYFIDFSDPDTGLIADATKNNYSSIAATGFGLSALCIGVERGWIARAKAEERVLKILNTFQSKTFQKDGFFYHFLNMENAERFGDCEVSSIDTAILVAGMLTAAEYFGGKIKLLSYKIHERINWNSFINQNPDDENYGLFSMGWKPGSAVDGQHLGSYWNYYTDEVVLIDLLSMGSKSFPTSEDQFYRWKREKGKYKSGNELIMSWHGGLFAYQYAHAWIDFRGLTDKTGIDWWQNSVDATLANKQFCLDQGMKYQAFGKGYWGVTSFAYPRQVSSNAGDGVVEDYTMNYGTLPSGNGYPLYDGTVAPSGPLGSIVFTPEMSMTMIRQLIREYPRTWGHYGFIASFNLDLDWWSTTYFGIDLGISLLMIENYRSGLIWKTFMKSPVIKNAMKIAGFKQTGKIEDIHQISGIMQMQHEDEVSNTVDEVVTNSDDLLLIQDFNDASASRKGIYGTWDKDPDDESQSCSMQINTQDTPDHSEGSLELTYDVDSTNAAFNGFWLKLDQLDASQYSKLIFWVKSIEDTQKTFKVELKTDSGIGSTYVRKISTNWEKIEISFDQFKSIKDFSSLNELVIVFEDGSVISKNGTILIDQISLLK